MGKNKKTYLIMGSLFLLLIGSIIGRDDEDREVIGETASIVTEQVDIEKGLSTKGYTIEEPNVVLNPYGISPLTALVMFETDEEEDIKVIVEGEGEARNIEGSSEKGKEHYVPVYGLYPDKVNKVTIETGNKKVDLEIKTEPLPEDFPLPEDVISTEEVRKSDEMYFFTPSGRGYTSAYDSNGDVRWYLTEKMVWDISRLKNGNMLLSTERIINQPYFTTGLYEMDLMGKIYNEYSLKGGYHHDYFELEDGNLLVLSNDFNNTNGTVEDYIVELDRGTGEIVKEWDLKETLDMSEGKSENWTPYDWFHSNSIWYDEDEEVIILSGRHQDAVIAIDYDMGKLEWIIGDPTGWSEKYQDYFFEPIGEDFEWQWSQHSAKVTPEGYISVLDNGNNKSKIKEEYVPAEESYTRGVMYDIDTEEMTIEQVWEYGKERGYEFYSPYISDVDYLGKDNYLVHSGGIVYDNGEISNQPAGFAKDPELYSTTVELKEDKVVFEMTLPTNMYRVEKMSLYNQSNYSVKEAERLGTLGVTKVSRQHDNKIKDLVEKDEDYEKNDISIEKEEDRLVVTGTYDKEESVTIKLEDNEIIREYDVIISKKPYTAMCIDMFTSYETEDVIEVSKYINSEGLKGLNKVYIKIGDKTYDTRLDVIF